MSELIYYLTLGEAKQARQTSLQNQPVRCIDCRFYPDNCGYWELDGKKDNKGNFISLVKPDCWHGCPDHEAREEAT